MGRINAAEQARRDAQDAAIAPDIKLRVDGAQAVRRLLKRCRNQHELARLLQTTQAEISRVARTRARASRRVMRDAVAIDVLLISVIDQTVAEVIAGRIASKKRAPQCSPIGPS